MELLMKLPTDQDIDIPNDNIYLNDKLSRELEVLNIVELITKLSNPCTIAVDSSWGTGKTTFLRFLQAELQQRDIKVSYFNAWEKDFDKEPFLLIVNHIVSEFSEKESDVREIKKIAINVLKSITVNGSKAVINSLLPAKVGDNLIDFFGNVTEEIASDIFEHLSQEEDEIKRLQEKLTLLVEKNNKMVILIDELDRCKPSFSIELLERIKHIFNTPNIIFVLGTDLDQLGKAISGVYGESYDGRKYLDRFFDFEFNLNIPTYEDFWQSLIENYTGKNDIETLNNKSDILTYGLWFTQHLHLSARDVKRLYTKFYLASLSEYSGHNLPLILLLSVVKNHSKALYTNIKLNSFNLDELFEFMKFKNITLMHTNDEITSKILVLIHNLLLANQNEVKSSEIIDLLSKNFANPSMKAFIEHFLDRYKDDEKLSIDNLESVYKAVDLQGISHKQFASVSASIQASFGQATVTSSN